MGKKHLLAAGCAANARCCLVCSRQPYDLSLHPGGRAPSLGWREAHCQQPTLCAPCSGPRAINMWPDRDGPGVQWLLEPAEQGLPPGTSLVGVPIRLRVSDPAAGRRPSAACARGTEPCPAER